MSEITKIRGIGPVLAAACTKTGFTTIQKIATSTPDALAAIPGISRSRGSNFIAAAKALVKATPTIKQRAAAKVTTKPETEKSGKKTSMKKKPTKAKKTKKDDKKKSKKKDKKANKKKSKKKKGGKKK
jgi:hypothetical protein